MTEMWIFNIHGWGCHKWITYLHTVQRLKSKCLWQSIRVTTAICHVPSHDISQKWTKSALPLHLIWRPLLLSLFSVLEFKWLSSCSVFSDTSKFRPFHQSNSLRHVPAVKLPFYFYHGKSNSLVSLCNSHISWRIK